MKRGSSSQESGISPFGKGRGTVPGHADEPLRGTLPSESYFTNSHLKEALSSQEVSVPSSSRGGTEHNRPRLHRRLHTSGHAPQHGAHRPSCPK